MLAHERATPSHAAIVKRTDYNTQRRSPTADSVVGEQKCGSTCDVSPRLMLLSQACDDVISRKGLKAQLCYLGTFGYDAVLPQVRTLGSPTAIGVTVKTLVIRWLPASAGQADKRCDEGVRS